MSLTLYAFQRSGLELDTEQQPQGGSPYGSSYDSVNGSPRVVPSHGMPLGLPHTSSLSRKARVAPTSGGSSQPDSPNLARFSRPSPSPPPLTHQLAHTHTQALLGWR